MAIEEPARSPATRRHPYLLPVVVLAWGVQAIVTQSLLLREATVLMSGSELVWGIVLSTWLAGVAGGAWIGGRVARTAACSHLALTVTLLLLGVLACASIWGFREARAICGIGPGELLSLGTVAAVATVLVLPCGLMVGMAFPLASMLRDENAAETAGSPINRVYALESAGSLLGGALFSFWAVEHLSPIQTILICTAVTGAALSVLLVAAGSRWIGGAIVLGIAAGAALAAGLAGPAINRFLVERRWGHLAPACELVAEAESRYQNLAVGKMAEQYTLYCDGQVSTNFPDPSTFAPLAHFWMCQHPKPRQVLLLGGGVEGLLSEILKHPVEHVDCVESDPRLVALIEPYLSPEDRAALRDPRVTVHHLDARLYVKTQRNRFDLVIARLPEPTSALQARFYTCEFFSELRRAMTDRSVLCLSAAAGSTRLSAASARYLAGARNTVAASFAEVVVSWDDPARILAATQAGLTSTDAGELSRRYEARGVKSSSFHPLLFSSAAGSFTAEKIRQRAEELDAATGAAVSTDLHPIVYMHRAALWEKMTAAHSRRLIEHLLGVNRWQVIAALTIMLVAVPAAHRLVGRSVGEGAVILSVGSTGFATMSLSIVWLFAFQNLYGYVYQWIGWIIAVFMGGLVIGCAWAGRVPRPARRVALAACLPVSSVQRRRLIVVDLLIAVLAALAPFLLPPLARIQTSASTLALVQACIIILVLATGVLGGAAFALASKLHSSISGRPTATAGAIVGADNAGGLLGALATGVLLVPVFGTAATCLLLAGTKLVSALILLLAKKTASVGHVDAPGC